jgi:hypothetical protein
MYNVHYCFKLHGNANVLSIVAALKKIYFEHDILRSCIVEQDHEIFQCIKTAEEIPLVVDVVPYSKISIDCDLKEDSTFKFSLEADPKMRCRVYCDEDKSIMISLCFHHMSFDGCAEKRCR